MLDYQDPPNYEFRLSTNSDARSAMNDELNKILTSVPDNLRPDMTTNIAGFQTLFDKFVTEPGPSVEWDKIEKLPANSVRLF